jgi:osmotically-inducible protein OsmY
MTFQDLELTAKIKAAFARAEDVSARDIDVDVNNGVVSLQGDVSKNEHDKAVEIARGIPGIRGVEDLMRVTSQD